MWDRHKAHIHPSKLIQEFLSYLSLADVIDSTISIVAIATDTILSSSTEGYRKAVQISKKDEEHADVRTVTICCWMFWMLYDFAMHLGSNICQISIMAKQTTSP